MTDPKEKTPVIKTREPRPKQPQTFANLRTLPHPIEEFIPPARDTRVTPVAPVTRVTSDAAPRKDFTRAANSIVRDAVPAGLFSGKGKQLYDYLYSRTRGAIVPVTSVRLPKSEVMRGADMTRPTYRNQLSRLIAVGLVKVEAIGGDHSGNLYTVFLPEETANPGYPGNPSYSGKELDGQPGQETDPGNPGLSVDYQRTSNDPKTSSLRQDRSDDEAAARLFEQLQAIEFEVTGKRSNDLSKWPEVLEVLKAELLIAAARTTVSNVPAFLAEHLRRRLWKTAARLERGPENASEGQQTPAIGDSKNCPDCAGVGFFYPEGYEKGACS